MRTRRATLPDAAQINDLIVIYSPSGMLLPRPLPELYENVRDFIVVEDEGKVVGCGALHFYGPHLAEIRSIAVHPSMQKQGVGRRIIDALMREAKRHQISSVCLFTRAPEFFARMGFALAHREELPDKIFKDCVNCPRKDACDEVAMIRGGKPSYTIVGTVIEPHIPLFQGN